MSSAEKSEQAEGTFAVLLALGANLGVAVLKLFLVSTRVDLVDTLSAGEE